jgi:hypothetical protein
MGGPWRERLWRQKPMPLDRFARIELDSTAKADHTLVFHTRARAWLRFSSDPWHWFGGSLPFSVADLTPLESFLFTNRNRAESTSRVNQEK